MKKIDIVTYWAGNYGSVLQSFSLCKALNKMGFKAEVIYQSEKGIRKYLHRIYVLKNIITNSIFYPSYLKNYSLIRKSSKASKNNITQDALKQLDEFVRVHISPRGVGYYEIKKESTKENIHCFIAGSDQIWNGYTPYAPFCFLQFAPKEKRVAYAPSFGTESIANYNKIKFSKAIESFSYISSREKRGIYIIKELTHLDALQLPDPTVLISKDEWNGFYEKRIEDEPYIFAHFLDTPSDLAIKVLEDYKKRHHYKIICFSYPHHDIESLGGIIYSGSPEDYISGIANADAIFTDSFHTTLFSIRFNRQFYVFDRQYRHGFTQTSRITSLLQDCGYDERLIERYSDAKTLPDSLHNCDEYFKNERNKAIHFLEESLYSVETDIPSPKIKRAYECTGCGVCEMKCPVEAISLNANEKGFFVPTIDYNLCVKCGLCEKSCNLPAIIPTGVKKAYIAYNNDDCMRASSASGGVFSAIAVSIIKRGGIAFGACIDFSKGVIVEHRAAKTIEELDPLLKSKYVQSDCRRAFPEIKQLLDSGKEVLFGGTSCQVVALQQYLEKPYPLLYTVDLICHGVPGIKFFQDYIHYLSKKYNSPVVNFEFREKKDGDINYTEVIEFKDGSIKRIPWKQSLYYQQFLRCESYRDCCYDCDYATIEKPGDITIGDYFEAKNDYKALLEDNGLLEKKLDISCLLINSKKGHELVEKNGNKLQMIEVDVKRVQLSHNQLCFPSRHSPFRYKLFDMYKKGGFSRISQYFFIKKIIMYLPRKVYRFIKAY